jgi:8-oxo-dGTP pyrophosphatase MutT (NUDIX family)
MEVARTALDGVPEEFVYGHPRCIFGTRGADPERMVPGYYPCVMADQEGSPAPGEPGRPKRRRRRRRKQTSSGQGANAAAKSSSARGSIERSASKKGSSKQGSQTRSGAGGTRTRKDAGRNEPKAKGEAAKGAARSSRIPTQREVSAGGVLYRRADGDIEVVLASRRTRRGDLAWGLAKGGIERGETREQAALREVREETGLDATIEADLGDTRYIYVWEDVRIRKRVHFFLMRHTGGNVEDRDDEMEEVRWFPLERALKRAAYRGERDVLARAAELLR